MAVIVPGCACEISPRVAQSYTNNAKDGRIMYPTKTSCYAWLASRVKFIRGIIRKSTVHMGHALSWDLLLTDRFVSMTQLFALRGMSTHCYKPLRCENIARFPVVHLGELALGGPALR